MKDMCPKVARILAGYTQEQIAKVLMIHRTTYVELEKQPERLTVAQVKQLCKLYRLPIEELLKGELKKL